MIRGLVGIIFFVQFFFLAFNYGTLEHFFSEVNYSHLYEGGRDLYWVENIYFISVMSLIALIKGCHLIYTSPFDGILTAMSVGVAKPMDGEYNNIERIKRYRDDKLSMMDNETASKEYRKTMWIDGVDSSSGKNTTRAKNYIDSKLGVMDNESAYKYIKGE